MKERRDDEDILEEGDWSDEVLVDLDLDELDEIDELDPLEVLDVLDELDEL